MKEIQLIKLIEKYIEKYNGYQNDLINILTELKKSFSETKTILNEYFIGNIFIKSKKEQFKDFIKNYKETLSSQQEKIIKIIGKNNRGTTNLVLFIFIVIIVFAKFLLEIYFLYFKLLIIIMK